MNADRSRADHFLSGRGVVALLVALFGIALLVRGLSGFNGGIWADESFVLQIIDEPTWTAMLDFLRLHESHPPLFYVLMRAWTSVAGGGDVTALALPIVTGALIVPVLFLAGRYFFSARVGLLAAVLGAVSPALVEYAAQIRPYGLLPLLVLISCCMMVTALERRGLWRWSAYVALTAALLYTHNWAWIVAIGQQLAFVVVALTSRRATLGKDIRAWGAAWVAIGVLYLPWTSTLLFQARHAGHPAIPVSGVAERLEMAIVKTVNSIGALFPGSLPESRLAVLLVAGGTGICAALLYSFGHYFFSGPSQLSVASEMRGSDRRTAMHIFLTVPAGSLLTAAALSPQSDLLLPRCVAMLIPPLLLVFAYWCTRQWQDRGARQSHSRFAGSLLSFVIAQSVFGVYVLATRPRSNAREVTTVVARNARPTDLIILAPEWYAPTFNHYYSLPTEQIDYPYSGRSGLIDFSHLWERTADVSALGGVLSRIAAARDAGRRVWLVSGPPFVRDITDDEVERAVRYQLPRGMANLRMSQIRGTLDRMYGAPDTLRVLGAHAPRYHEFTAWLYSSRTNREISLSAGQ